MNKTVCPICGKETFFQQGQQQNRFFPFCSERCRWVDLGNWLDGRYRIPAEEQNVSEEEPPTAAEETSSE